MRKREQAPHAQIGTSGPDRLPLLSSSLILGMVVDDYVAKRRVNVMCQKHHASLPQGRRTRLRLLEVPAIGLFPVLFPNLELLQNAPFTGTRVRKCRRPRF